MPLNYATIKGWKFPRTEHTHGVRDVLLYAATLNIGEDPLAFAQLPFLDAEKPRVVPSFAVTLGYPGLWMRDPATGIDWRHMVHAEQRMRLYERLCPAQTLRAEHRVTHVADKGPGRGALVVVRRTLRDSQDTLVAELDQASLCRADGGFGGGDEPPDPLPACPQRPPDLSRTLSTSPQQALLYRLNGDMNPLHSDPEVAAAAGFAGPILHGLCTYGLAARAILETSELQGRRTALTRLDARFSRPVFPGETLRVHFWMANDGLVQFDAWSVERDVAVLTHGVAQFEQAA